MYGRLMEGTDKAIGIVERVAPTYQARCRLCNYRSFLCEYEVDAQHVLQKHVEQTSHREVVNRIAARSFEESVTVYKVGI